MPLFSYRAIKPPSQKVSGHIEAANAREAKQKLREQGLLVSHLEEGVGKGRGVRIKGEVLMTFTMQLSQLVTAGIPLHDALLALEEQYRSEKFHSIILALAEKVKSGCALSEAMSTFPDSFDRLYRVMVAAGEAAGALGTVLNRLHLFLDKQDALKRQITTAMIYPAVLAGFSMLMVIMLLGFVVPSLEAMFADREVNMLTSTVLSLSRFLNGYWMFYIPALAGIAFGLYYQMRSERFRLWWQASSLRIPGLRGLIIEAALARYCRTMATLLEGGLTLVDALGISGGVLKNHVIESIFDRARKRIEEGSSLSRELAKEPMVPKMMMRMLAVGEETGTSAAMFGRVADIYERDVEKNMGRVTALAQPLILVFMGLVVGVVLLAVLLPLLDISGFAD